MLFVTIFSFGQVAPYKNLLNNYVYKALEIPWMANLCYWDFSKKLTFEYWDNKNSNPNSTPATQRLNVMNLQFSVVVNVQLWFNRRAAKWFNCSPPISSLFAEIKQTGKKMRSSHKPTKKIQASVQRYVPYATERRSSQSFLVIRQKRTTNNVFNYLFCSNQKSETQKSSFSNSKLR